MQMVSEVMTRNVQYVSPRETVRRAAQMMDDLNVGALPVCDGDRLVGMVTDRDITVRATSAGLAPDDVMVDDVMSIDVRWCFEDQPVEEVMRQMADTQIRRVPVVSHDDAHRLIGIVSLGDIATKSAGASDIDKVVEKVSYPSTPDLAPRGGAAPAVRASETGTATGLAGTTVLEERMNPETENASTADPSDLVEVTPDELLNKDAPGSRSMRSTIGMQDRDIVVRHVNGGGDDTSTGESGAPAGIDAGGPAGASGGTAGAAGSSGTGVGAKP